MSKNTGRHAGARVRFTKKFGKWPKGSIGVVLDHPGRDDNHANVRMQGKDEIANNVPITWYTTVKEKANVYENAVQSHSGREKPCTNFLETKNRHHR